MTEPTIPIYWEIDHPLPDRMDALAVDLFKKAKEATPKDGFDPDLYLLLGAAVGLMRLAAQEMRRTESPSQLNS